MIFCWHRSPEQTHADPSTVLSVKARLQKEPLFSSRRQSYPILVFVRMQRPPPPPLLRHPRVSTSRSLTKASRQWRGLIFVQDAKYKPSMRASRRCIHGLLCCRYRRTVKPADTQHGALYSCFRPHSFRCHGILSPRPVCDRGFTLIPAGINCAVPNIHSCTVSDVTCTASCSYRE